MIERFVRTTMMTIHSNQFMEAGMITITISPTDVCQAPGRLVLHSNLEIFQAPVPRRDRELDGFNLLIAPVKNDVFDRHPRVLTIVNDMPAWLAPRSNLNSLATRAFDREPIAVARAPRERATDSAAIHVE